MIQLHRFRTPILALSALLLFPPLDARGQSNAEPEEFSAFAINMGSYVVGSTANLIITVNRWTSDEERARLLTTLREKGTQALFEALQDTKSVGTIRTSQTVGYDLRLAIQDPGEDGMRRIIIATDRPLSFAEARGRPPSADYQFTVLDMQMRPDGSGQGTMSLAAKIIPAGKNIVVENYDTQPIRLSKIESRKLKKR
jgi:hypothetical protein